MKSYLILCQHSGSYKVNDDALLYTSDKCFNAFVQVKIILTYT